MSAVIETEPVEAEAPAAIQLSNEEYLASMDPTDRAEAEDRAEQRLSQLARSFATMMHVVAVMYRDEDWRFITREDGTHYDNLTQVVQDVTQKSASMARRYVQGARDIYLPLSAIVLDDVRINVDSKAIQDLGVDGAALVVERVAERVSGIDDKFEQETILGDTVAEVRAERAQRQRFDDPHDEDHDDVTLDEDVAANGWSNGQFCGLDVDGLPCFLKKGHSGDHDPDGEGDGPPQPMSFAGDIVIPDDGPAPSVDTDMDPTERILASGADYLAAEAREALPADLRPIVEALAILSTLDATQFASSISYETRGVAKLIPGALTNLTRSRALVETSTWLMQRT